MPDKTPPLRHLLATRSLFVVVVLFCCFAADGEGVIVNRELIKFLLSFGIETTGDFYPQAQCVLAKPKRVEVFLTLSLSLSLGHSRAHLCL